jgi:hypothetical protein
MSAIRSRSNAATELRLIALVRANGITGWRRGATLRIHSRSRSAAPSTLRRPSVRH